MKVTLTGPDGLEMDGLSTVRYHWASVQSVEFPVFDPNTWYRLTVTPSEGLTGGGSFSFNSSAVTYVQNEFSPPAFEILSDLPEIDDPPLAQEPDIFAADRWGPDNYNGSSRFVVVQGGELDAPWNEGVLCGATVIGYQNLFCGKQGMSAESPQILTAQIADQPLHGTVTLNSDGSFTYTAERGFWGQDFFRYMASNGEKESLKGTVYVVVQPKCSCFEKEPLDPFAVAAAAAETEIQFLNRRSPAQLHAVGQKAVVVSKIKYELKLSLWRNNGGELEFSKEAIAGPIIDLLTDKKDPIDILWDWVKELGKDPTNIQKYLGFVKIIEGLTNAPTFYQIDGEINVRPVGNLYQVVNKGGIRCWQLVRPYTGSRAQKLDGHTMDFPPIPITLTPDTPVTNTAAWQELIEKFKLFFQEFMQKIKNNRTEVDPKTWALA